MGGCGGRRGRQSGRGRREDKTYVTPSSSPPSPSPARYAVSLLPCLYLT
ncbi:hypothetical protein E2C01_074975 [Portunus trituberculatus]|uniref:Uncharacterized protein n=1 Tax=Portunus trituberculatus TaxID=210409 RepID=A0A5B7IFP6_PORTR|nr:hypothetical protein [Portunus trituberculatus]